MDFPISVPNIGLVGGVFVDEDQLAGTPGSLIPSAWGNAITEEVLNVITAGGLVPSEADVTQLLKAIRAINKQPVMLVDTGTAGVYKAANSPALTAFPTSGYIQCVNIANLNPGAATYQPDGLAAKPIYGLGLQPLQGGELPPGPAVLMYLVQAGVNSGNGAWILIESLGGAMQVPPATKSQHAIQHGQVQSMFASPIGTATNVRMTIAAASATATLTADEIVVGTALGGQTYRLAGFNKVINLANTGAGGRDTGAVPVNGYVALYAIYNPTTDTSALLAVNATSTIAPAVYGGANMPAGYTASALLTVVPTNASSQFKVCSVRGRSVSITLATVLTSTSNVAASNISISAAVPPNAVRILGELGMSSSSASNLSVSIFSDAANNVGQQNVSGAVAAAGNLFGNFSGVLILTPQTVGVSASTSGAGPTFNVYVGGYDI